MSARTLTVVSAGLSSPSSTRLLADRLAQAVVQQSMSGQEVVVVSIELRELAHAITDNLLTGFPPDRLREALDAVRNADALIAVTPIFSASYSGLFKSFVDVLDRDALTDKPALIAATGGSARHSLALEYAVRPLMSYLRARTVPTAVFAATDDFGSDDAGSSLSSRIAGAAAELLSAMDSYRPKSLVDAFDLTSSFDELLARR